MTYRQRRATHRNPVPPGPGSRLVVISRGDPLTPYLHAALADRYPVVADIDVELRGVRRAVVAAAHFRPSMADWAAAYMQSTRAYEVRSRLARRRLRSVGQPFDIVFQTHGLFSCAPYPTVIYVDCTYRQAMQDWPAWTHRREATRVEWLRQETHSYQSALHLFAFNNSVRESLMADYGVEASRVTVVGAGANLDVRALPASQETFVRAPTVLFVGKDFFRKGGEVLLRAFAKVRRVVPEARLQIVGPTDLDGDVPPGVELVGLIGDRNRLMQFYAEADVFCLPSRFDPGAIAVLEAMAHGLPCVLTRDSSQLVHDLVDDGTSGRMVETDDEDGLADALLELLLDPELARTLGASARDTVLSDRLWPHVVGRMAPVLDALAAPS